MKILKDIVGVLFSNIVTIIAGICVSFLVPKMLSVEGYGMYKTFTLYSNYLGICSIGIIDGIVLRYGEKGYDQLDRKLFRSYFSWYMIAISSITMLLVLVLPSVVDEQYCFIVFMLAAYLIAMNVTGYFQQISQITQRFKEYSLRKILQSISTVLIILPLFISFCFGNEISYKSYVILLIVVNYLLTGWYIYTYKDIVFGEKYSLKNTRSDIVSICKQGFPLLFANLSSTLILSLDRQFVSSLFTTEEYATYAFAYSMLSLVTVATSAIATVIYPMLKRMDIQKLKEHYSTMLGIVVTLVFGICLAYFPLYIFIEWFLPKYMESIVIFRIILPGIAVTSAITVIMHNYYKVFGKSMDFFKISVLVLGISCVFNYFAFKICGTRESISCASIITMFIWFFIAERKINKECLMQNNMNNIVYIIIMMVAFYVCSFCVTTFFIRCVIYIVLFVAVTIIFQKKNLCIFISMIKNNE